jgi:SAM-dependent methyltransferase
MTTSHNDQIKKQFDLRANTFEESVRWVRDPKLVSAHIEMAGRATGPAIELCCGTGSVARGLHAAGWDVTGVDISEGMVREAKKHVRAMVGDVADLPFATHSVDLVVMRQAYFLLEDGPAALREVRRVLKPGGKFILSHLVPFSEVDQDHLRKIHTTKQAQMKEFHTSETLTEELERSEFSVVEEKFVVVRESVSLWMREAPELSEETRQAVCNMVVNSPPDYKKLHNVQVVRGEILEDWNFVLLESTPGQIE